MEKLGLIAGAGGLPLEIVRACQTAERSVFVLRLLGLTDPALAEQPGVDVGLAEWGKMFSALRRAGCRQICFAGAVPRPDFASLKPDLRGLASLPRVLAAARKGDDALMRQVMHEFEQEGFVVEGADTVMSGLTIGNGPLGRILPRDADAADIDQALRVARALARWTSARRWWWPTAWCWPSRRRKAPTRCCSGAPTCHERFARTGRPPLACSPRRSNRSRTGASTYRP